MLENLQFETEEELINFLEYDEKYSIIYEFADYIKREKQYDLTLREFINKFYSTKIVKEK